MLACYEFHRLAFFITFPFFRFSFPTALGKLEQPVVGIVPDPSVEYPLTDRFEPAIAGIFTVLFPERAGGQEAIGPWILLEEFLHGCLSAHRQQRLYFNGRKNIPVIEK